MEHRERRKRRLKCEPAYTAHLTLTPSPYLTTSTHPHPRGYLHSYPTHPHHYRQSLFWLVTVCSALGALSRLCYAQADSAEFALRPFQASPHQSARRQDGHHAHHHNQFQPFELSTRQFLPPPAAVSQNDPGLVPILTAPVPRGSSSNPRPSFQRIRLNKQQSQSTPLAQPLRQTRPPPVSDTFSPMFTESPQVNFQRLVGITPPLQSSVHSSPLQPAQPSQPAGRQSFRRVKPPNSGTRRVKPKPVTSQKPFLESSRAFFEPSPVSSRRMASPAISLSPISNPKLRGRGPISAQDDDLSHKPNLLDHEDELSINGERSSYFGNRVTTSETAGFDDNGILVIESLSRSNSVFEPVRSTALHHPPLQSPVPTPTIPLTYYTTYTYYTTVLRGHHTAMLSRELVSSTTQVRPIDRSIVTAIELNDGYVQPSRSQVLVGTKTKGVTTTIYNVASRVQVFNDDLYKVIFATRSRILPQIVSSNAPVNSRIQPTQVSSSLPPIEPTRTLSRPQLASQRVRQPTNVKIEDLQEQPKKQLSRFTYFYTFMNGGTTHYSTRTEESATPYSGNLATLTASLASTIDSEGLLEIISPSSTIALGSRAHGPMTTVVNLELNNYIMFDRVKGAKLEIKPTSVSYQTHSEPTRLPTISSSMEGPESSQPAISSPKLETPRLSSSVESQSSSLFVPVLSSSVLRSSILASSSRTRASSSRRPGIRVKVKPIRSKLVSHASRISSSSHSSSATLRESSTLLTLSSLQLTPTIVDQTPVLSTSSITSETPLATPSLPQRKKFAYTVRRPGISGVSRIFSRRPSSHLLQRSSSVALASLASLASPATTPAMASSIAPSSSPSPSSQLAPTPSLELPLSSTIVLEPSLSPSPVWQPAHSKSSKQRYVITRIAGAHRDQWNPINNSRIRVSSRKIFKSTSWPLSSSNVIEPSSSVVETVLETTTHTVPFTFGSSIIYTTVEETNSRVVTRSIVDISSSSVTSFSSSSIAPSSTVDFETSTQLTTMTYYNTIYTSNTSMVKSTEKTMSSLVTVPRIVPASPMVITETSDILTTSTLYSTFTYFATLFNGSQTTITPLEEIKTEYLTLREPVTITRTILPTDALTISPSSTSFAQPSTISVAAAVESGEASPIEPSMVTETYSTHTTLTHFITLFSGSHTILSSIEEISPTVMTRTRTLLSTSLQHSESHVVDSSLITSSMMTSSPVYSSSGTTTSSSIQVLSSIIEITSSSSVMPAPSPVLLAESILYDQEQANQDMSSVASVMIGPSKTLLSEQYSSSTTAAIQPGSVIELNDLLEGVHDAGQIGEVIKDIVKDIVIDPKVMDKEEESTSSSVFTTTTSSTSMETTDSSLATLFETTIAPSFTPAKTTSSINRYPVYVASKNMPKYYDTTSEDKSMVIFSTQSEGDQLEPSMSTRYVTSIDKSIRTLTLTSTKVYYTRDSPLTITSVLTTTLPPITYVSTIIGTKTILGTYNSITPTKTDVSSRLMSTPSVSPASSTYILSSSSVLPVATTRPRLHRPKEPNVLKAKVTPFLSGRKPAKPNPNQTSPMMTMRNRTNSMIDHQMCNPTCNVTNKEMCKEVETSRYACECRPGYVRRPSDNLCQEIKNYLVMVRVSKTAESEVAATTADGDLQTYARVARRQVGKQNGIAGLQVLSVDHSTRSKGALVNLTIQIDPKGGNVQDELSKKLEPLGQVEKVVDFDECTSPTHHDCSPRARCINQPGSYSCQCLEPYIDLDQSLPGRLCVSEIKSCDYCHGRGDCWRNGADTVCRCHPMFIGRRCEINGLLLAILVPIVAILIIIAIVSFLYCSRKFRQRNRRFKNLAAYGPVAVIGGTLDRKAMLETSSESSDPQHRSSHYTSESNPASARGSMARRNPSTSRRESEPSLDRASYAGGGGGGASSNYNSLPPQIMIPRARPTYTIHPGQVYMW